MILKPESSKPYCKSELLPKPNANRIPSPKPNSNYMHYVMSTTDVLLGLLWFYYSISGSVLVGFSQKTVVSVFPGFGFYMKYG